MRAATQVNPIRPRYTKDSGDPPGEWGSLRLTGKKRANALVELSGVIGGGTCGRMSRGTWETLQDAVEAATPAYKAKPKWWVVLAGSRTCP